MSGQRGFWDVEERYALLSKAGDPLERLDEVIPWDVFRKPLAKALKRSDGSKGGRPPFPALMMFKILVLQALYDLSDDQAEYVINDRLSFMRFIGVELGEKVPDAKTIWLFREHLTQARAVDNLFARFDKHLARNGYLAMGGQIVDATIVAAPKQRNKDDEKEAIKEGKSANGIWPDEPNKAAQKDIHARWTVKYSKAKQKADGSTHKTDIAIPSFGYKDHISIDRSHGLIRTWKVTDAARYDGAQLPDLITRDNTGSSVWADTAYRSKKNEAWLHKNGFISHIHTKKPKGRDMSERAKAANSRRSKIRSFVEHPFARIKHAMGLTVRTIGIARATTKIGMANLVYNFQRVAWLNKRSASG
jgi:IS5 family transposase